MKKCTCNDDDDSLVIYIPVNIIQEDGSVIMTGSMQVHATQGRITWTV